MFRTKWLIIALTIMLVPGAANAFIFDGAHHDGNPHFYFLPPMVPAPDLPGAFDPTLDPVVEIVDLFPGDVVAEFTMDDALQIDDEGSAYIVSWHTRDFNLDSGNIYRVRVSIEGVSLGFADVALVDSP